MIQRKKHTLYALAFFMAVSTAGLIFHDSVGNYCATVSWVAVLSMGIFLGGVFYAVLERNVIAGFITAAAAVALPWVKAWVVAYWPWVHQCLIAHHFFHH